MNKRRLLGCALLGLAAGTVGTFSLLRGRALVADAVGHAALPGVAIAALIVATLGGDPRSLPPLLAGAATAGVLGVLAVQALARTGRVRGGAALAIVPPPFHAPPGREQVEYDALVIDAARILLDHGLRGLDWPATVSLPNLTLPTNAEVYASGVRGPYNKKLKDTSR